MRSSRKLSHIAVPLASSLLCACVPANPKTGALRSADGAEGVQAEVAQPRHASYDCGAAGSLTVENFRTSVLLVAPDGESVELPAAPASQTTRYGEPPYALVLDGAEALYMKNGREPLTCRR